GDVRVYYSTDDTTDAKTAASPLSYPFENTPGIPDLPVNLADPVTTYSFLQVTTGTIDRYPLLRSGDVGARNLLAMDVETDNAVTLVLVENDAGVAATYAGQTPDAPYSAPELVVYAAQRSACLGDLNYDYQVDLTDLAQLLGCFGQCAGGPA